MGVSRWNAMTWQMVQKLMRVEYTSEGTGCAGTNFTQDVDQTNTQHSLVYCSLIRNIFCLARIGRVPLATLFTWPGLCQDWSKDVSSHLQTPGKKEKKRGREEKSQKGAYCSLFTLVFWWMRTFHNTLSLLFFSFFILSLAKKERKK